MNAVDLLVYGPAEVKRALKLRTLAAAKALWNRPDFPALPTEGNALAVHPDDLRAWWRAEAKRLRACVDTTAKDASLPEPEPRDDERPALTGGVAFDVDWSRFSLT